MHKLEFYSVISVSIIHFMFGLPVNINVVLQT